MNEWATFLKVYSREVVLSALGVLLANLRSKTMFLSIHLRVCTFGAIHLVNPIHFWKVEPCRQIHGWRTLLKIYLKVHVAHWQTYALSIPSQSSSFAQVTFILTTNAENATVFASLSRTSNEQCSSTLYTTVTRPVWQRTSLICNYTRVSLRHTNRT